MSARNIKRNIDKTSHILLSGKSLLQKPDIEVTQTGKKFMGELYVCGKPTIACTHCWSMFACIVNMTKHVLRNHLNVDYFNKQCVIKDAKYTMNKNATTHKFVAKIKEGSNIKTISYEREVPTKKEQYDLAMQISANSYIAATGRLPKPGIKRKSLLISPSTTINQQIYPATDFDQDLNHKENHNPWSWQKKIFPNFSKAFDTSIAIDGWNEMNPAPTINSLQNIKQCHNHYNDINGNYDKLGLKMREIEANLNKKLSLHDANIASKNIVKQTKAKNDNLQNRSNEKVKTVTDKITADYTIMPSGQNLMQPGQRAKNIKDKMLKKQVPDKKKAGACQKPAKLNIPSKIKIKADNNTCKLCNKTFKNAVGLKIHARKLHKMKATLDNSKICNNSMIEKCDQSNMIFHTKEGKIMHGKETYVVITCPVCHKGFFSIQEFEKHYNECC